MKSVIFMPKYTNEIFSSACFHCSSTIVIRNDYTVYDADINVYEPCDSLYKPIPGRDTVTVIYKTGIIPHSGKPVFTEVKEKKLP